MVEATEKRAGCALGQVPRALPRRASSRYPTRAIKSGRSAMAARSGRAAMLETSSACTLFGKRGAQQCSMALRHFLNIPPHGMHARHIAQ